MLLGALFFQFVLINHFHAFSSRTFFLFLSFYLALLYFERCSFFLETFYAIIKVRSLFVENLLLELVLSMEAVVPFLNGLFVSYSTFTMDFNSSGLFGLFLLEVNLLLLEQVEFCVQTHFSLYEIKAFDFINFTTLICLLYK